MASKHDLPPDDDDHPDIVETSSFKPPFTAEVFAFIGEPRTGKSTLIKRIMYYYHKHKYFHYGLVISGSSWNGDYDFLPSKCIWDKWDEDRLKQYIKVLEDRAHELHKNKKGAKLPPSFLILDDLLGQIANSDWFKSFLARFRQYNITVMIAAQYAAEAKGCSTLFRSVCDVAFMFPTMMHNSLEAMKNAWGGYFESLNDFKDAMIQVKTRKHACLVFQKRLNSKEEAYTSLLVEPAPKEFKMTFTKSNNEIDIPEKVEPTDEEKY